MSNVRHRDSNSGPQMNSTRSTEGLTRSSYQAATVSAGWTTRVAYTLTVVSVVLPVGTSGWVSLALGRVGAGGFLFLPLLLLLVLGIARIVNVWRDPDLLDAYVYSRYQNTLLVVARFLLYVGALSLLLRFAVPWITRATLGEGPNGIGYFVVGTMIALLGSGGTFSLVAFEFARMLGFEQHRRASRSKPIFRDTRPQSGGSRHDA